MNIQKYVLFILSLAFLIQSCSTDHFTQMNYSKLLDTSNLIESDITTQTKNQTTENVAMEVNKKAETQIIVPSTKRDFVNKIHNAWSIPVGLSAQKATARIILTESGAVSSIILVNASDPMLKESIVQAVYSAAPFPMPSDPDARREARSFTASFTVK
ncbi:cell envelope integrity protein TolA [Acinetobacter piscicola]